MAKFNKERQLFTPAEEEVFVQFTKTLAVRQLPLTHELLTEKANAILLLRNNGPHTVGKTCLRRFMNRHLDTLLMYWSSGMENK